LTVNDTVGLVAAIRYFEYQKFNVRVQRLANAVH
jgi:hypothetical protein